MKKKANRLFAVFCAIMLAFTLMPTAVSAETAAEKYERLKQELAAINQQIENYKDDKSQAQQLKDAYIAQQNKLLELRDAQKAQMETTQSELDTMKAELDAQRAALQEDDRLFNERLVAIYKMNNVNALSTLLNVNSFSELLTTLDGMKRLSMNDTQLLDEMGENIAEKERREKALNDKITELQAGYDELQSNMDALQANISNQTAKISDADARLEAEKLAGEDKYAELVAAQKEMQQIGGGLGGSGSNSSDGSTPSSYQFIRPVQGGYISCYYGEPDPNGAGHRGTDFAVGTGTPIGACAAGTVIIASYAHYSYGNYIVVDHGGGLKTLYAHCNSLNASVGQYVEQGSTIATVGSTGFSTGPHLHLEVTLDGVLQNPGNYVPY